MIRASNIAALKKLAFSYIFKWYCGFGYTIDKWCYIIRNYELVQWNGHYFVTIPIIYLCKMLSSQTYQLCVPSQRMSMPSNQGDFPFAFISTYKNWPNHLISPIHHISMENTRIEAEANWVHNIFLFQNLSSTYFYVNLYNFWMSLIVYN